MTEDDRTSAAPAAKVGPLTAAAGGTAAAMHRRTAASRGTSSPGARSPNFVTLWFIVCGLWTAATVLRMRRTWGDWPTSLSNPLSWLSLLLPPLVFALVLFGMSRIADAHHHRR